MSYAMREPCHQCGGAEGEVRPRNGQNCVFCLACDRFAYNAPRTETGEAQRSVQTVHTALRPKQRARILLRANGHCELCGAGGILHVGHLLSALDGFTVGLTDAEINHDDNLAAMCEECNLGLGGLSVPPRLMAALLKRRSAA